MRAHQAPLVRTEGLPLGQHFRRQGILADILQHAGEAEVEQALPAPADVHAEHHHVDRDVHRMVEGILVGAFQSQQPLQRVGIALEAAGDLTHALVDLTGVDRRLALDGLEGFLQRLRELVELRLDADQLLRQRVAVEPVLAVLQQGQEAAPALLERGGLQGFLPEHGRLAQGARGRSLRRTAAERPALQRAVELALFLDVPFLEGTLAVDINITAFFTEDVDLARRRNGESLQRKRQFAPRTIRLDHEHADLEVGNRYDFHPCRFPPRLK